MLRAVGAVGDAESKYYTFVAVFEDGSRRLVAVIGTDEGPRVDFDAFAVLQSHPWDDILAGKVASARVRVAIKESRYQVGKYQDPDHWVSYRMVTEFDEGVLYGMVERGSDIAKKLAESSRYGQAYPMLDIEIDPVDIQSKQVLIKRIHSEDWIEDVVAPAEEQ